MVDYDAAILGGGITGLATAYFLSKAGKKVIVIERGSQLGGVLKMTQHEADGVKYELEEFYHHVLSGDVDMINLLDELGISDTLEWRYPQTAFWREGKLYRLSGLLDLPKFKILSMAEKMHFAKLMAVVKFSKRPAKFDSITAKEFVVKYGSHSLWRKIFSPLLYSKFGSRRNEISGAWFVERLKIRSHTKNHIKGGGERIGYFRQGFKQVWGALAQESKKNCAIFMMNSPVEKIIVEQGRVKAVFAGKKQINCKWVVSTVPINFLKQMVKLPKDYVDCINKIEYQGVVCVTLGLRKKLNEKYYWINLAVDPPLRLGVILEHTNFIPSERYGNDNLVFLASYPDYGLPVWKWSYEKIFKEYFRDLQEIFPHITYDDIIWWHVAREEYAGILYKKGILKYIPPYKTPISGLLVAGMFNNYPERSTNISVRMGRELAHIISGENKSI